MRLGGGDRQVMPMRHGFGDGVIVWFVDIGCDGEVVELKRAA